MTNVHASNNPLPQVEVSQDVFKIPLTAARAHHVTEPAIGRTLSGPRLQPKLTVNQPGDRFEQEADRMADAVMRVPESVVQPKALPGGIPEISASTQSRIDALSGHGEPLSQADRGYFEARFRGHDFGRIRIHADGSTSELANLLNANAFTFGGDIVFAPGQYRPSSIEGRRLLAHELTHAVQQGAAPPRGGSRLFAGEKLACGDLKPGRGMVQREVRGRVTPEELAAVRRPPPRSGIVPDLEQSTVEELRSQLAGSVSDVRRQVLIDLVVADRTRAGMNFGIMEGGRPRYVATYPRQVLDQGGSAQANGITISPNSPVVNPSQLPLVLIGPPAFGSAADNLEERIVRLYSTIAHEYRHALQWQNPEQARAMGKPRREVEAFFWEIENSDHTGLRRQPAALRNTWTEATGWWTRFVGSPEWGLLDRETQRAYTRRRERVARIVESVTGAATPAGRSP